MTVEPWEAVRAYSQRLRGLCDPRREDPLDERLRPVYGRLHVGALKFAMLCAALRWLESDAERPTVTNDDWAVGQHLAEVLRGSAHRLLSELDRSGEASREMSLQEKMLAAFRTSDGRGRKLRDVYRNLHIPAKVARQTAEDLERAGMLIKTNVDGAEAYVLRGGVSH